ncbi:MAG: hypothetical protein JAZ11_13420 [Candidatus Thiodiazotropha lotti]|nr:hypothetical protein [Candidatus Thiodiazotropha lotti]
MKSNIYVHQTLHGYRDGHRLLAASTSLPAKSDHTIVVLSDLSGHSVVSEFDEYITGYPVPEMSAYALAKTWLAPEMPRPGCVWTHTLLIPFATLASIRSLKLLTNYFIRPNEDNVELFKQPVSQEKVLTATNLGQDTSVDGMAMSQILYDLYTSPIAPILVPTILPRLVEDSFFNIWSQQWPRLRRSFTFCTGAISGRRLGGKWFDLQGIPIKRVEEIARSINNAIVSRIEPDTSEIASIPWLVTATRDLLDDMGDLRDFLFEYGVEAEKGRSDFVPLTELFIALGDPLDSDANNLLRPMELAFPHFINGGKFKERLLSGKIGNTALQMPDTRLQILLESGENTFNTSDEMLQLLAEEAWHHNPESVISTINTALESKKDPPRNIIAAIAASISPNDVGINARQFESAMLAFAEHQPMILANSVFQGIPARNSILLDHLSKPKITANDVFTILQQWFEERDTEALEEAIKRNPKCTVPIILDTLNSGKSSDDHWLSSSILHQMISNHSEHATKWFYQNFVNLESQVSTVHTIAHVAASINDSDLRIDKKYSGSWEYLLSGPHNLDPDLRKTIMLKLFLRSMTVPIEEGARIATVTFPFVYRLPMKSQLSYSEWHALRNELGSYNWYLDWDWDKCRRLTEELIDRFKRYDWPICYFSTMLERDAELASFLKHTRFYKSTYEKFIDRLSDWKE